MVDPQESENAFRNRASDGKAVDKRVQLNRQLQQHDFSRWVLEILRPVRGERVLEIGCGRGAQTIPLAESIGNLGFVSFLDRSAESVDYVESMIAGTTGTNPLIGEMDNLDRLLADQVEEYDLAISVYALYYARDPKSVLKSIFNHLSHGGRLCVVGPDSPNGLVELARQFHSIPTSVDDSLQFRIATVEPFFKSHFDNVEIHILNNPLRFADPDLLAEFYGQTTYFDSSAKEDIRKLAAARMSNGTEFVLDKFSYAVIAKKSS